MRVLLAYLLSYPVPCYQGTSLITVYQSLLHYSFSCLKARSALTIQPTTYLVDVDMCLLVQVAVDGQVRVAGAEVTPKFRS